MSTPVAKKSIAERVSQAVLLEMLAVLICTPLFAWIMDTRLEQMGALTLANSLVSAAWILIFNVVTDRLRAWLGIQAGFFWRSAHAIGYEATLFLFTVPLAMWWLGIGLHQAVMLDIGLVLFFIPYTYLFHWAYDAARKVMSETESRGQV
jgi:uncharacterized membrane protein